MNAALVLAGLLLLAPAAHDTAPYQLPHHVANWFVEHNILRNADAAQRYSHLGCDDVVTFPIVDAVPEQERTIAGYMMLAQRPNGEVRLLAVEAWNFQKVKQFSWINQADYAQLRACYSDYSKLEV